MPLMRKGFSGGSGFAQVPRWYRHLHWPIGQGNYLCRSLMVPGWQLLNCALASGRSHTDAQTGHTGSEEEPDWDRSHVIICSPAGAGCSGRLKLRLTWESQAQQHPNIGAELLLDPLQVPAAPRSCLPNHPPCSESKALAENAAVQPGCGDCGKEACLHVMSFPAVAGSAASPPSASSGAPRSMP